MLKRLLLAVLLLLPVAAWAFIKPVRVLAPELVGITCSSESICIDDTSRYPEASKLYEEALQFVGTSAGEIEQRPRATFCATEGCSQSFGLGKRTAVTVGTFGIVISPRGWKPHYVRHEMIHHLQNERLGSFNNWLFGPKWFIEGMAYSLSEDPRPTLVESLEQYRSQFETWYKQVGKEQLWAEARNL